MMAVRFTGELSSGHKEPAIELPFDPTERWKLASERLWKGRRGHRVTGRLNGVPYESAVVARRGRYYLLVTPAMKRAADLRVGDMATVSVRPAKDV